jgi:hypothetical protein
MFVCGVKNMKGKPWSVNEEKQLRELVAAKTPFEVIAAKLGRRRDAITIKCKRLGLEVVVAKCYSTTTSLKVPKVLPSVEEAHLTRIFWLIIWIIVGLKLNLWI